MKIVVDENMPYAQELFCRTGKVVAVPGRALSAGMLKGADSLMVRSVTPVNQVLVENSGLRFVGTATAGTDHVDTATLEAAGIGFSSAAGCNAIAVVEYVLSALLALAERDGFVLNQRTIGIVGAGHVGSRLQQCCEALGMRTLISDPPRADRGDAGRFHSLETLVQQVDILTFHTPLNKEGRYKTRHLADEALLQSLLPGTILINASRGAVVDNPALLRTLQRRQDLRLVMDVWESEPDPDIALLQRADIGTAHIAGYTLEGKARGTTQIFAAWTAFLGDPQQVALDSLLPAPDISTVFLRGECDQAMLKRLAHLVYDVRRDDALLRQNIQQTGGFERLRKQYQPRREWSSLTIECDTAEAAGRLTQLGFTTRLR